jgi:hypothetical protein
MKISKFLIASIIVAGFAFAAQAQTAPSTTMPAPAIGAKNHPCMSEHQAVVAQCQKGDPCGQACKEAHKAMKQCRIANNLPTHPHSGAKKPSPCKTGSSAPTGSMPAPTAAPQTH